MGLLGPSERVISPPNTLHCSGPASNAESYPFALGGRQPGDVLLIREPLRHCSESVDGLDVTVAEDGHTGFSFAARGTPLEPGPGPRPVDVRGLLPLSLSASGGNVHIGPPG